MSKPVRIYLMAIKPKYAEMIYAGDKRFELRKMPPPCNTWIYLYESAPVSAVTGKVYIGMQIKGDSAIAWNFVKTQRYCRNELGVTEKQYKDYVGKSYHCSASMLFFAERFDKPWPLPQGVRPPQNWGRYYVGE